MGKAEALAERRPVLVLRGGRGKSGGSFALSHAVQRARHQGRHVRVLDADTRSETLLRAFGPPADWNPACGLRDIEWAEAPPSENPVVVGDWLMADLDRMASDRMSRVVDFNGGDGGVVSTVQRSLNLAPFCEAVGIDLLALITLGHEVEDFQHMVKAARAGHVRPEQALLVLNEAFVPEGTTVEDAFADIRRHPDFAALLKAGARAVYLRRLRCAQKLRDLGLGVYQAAYPTPERPNPSVTLQHMALQWIGDTEAKLAEAGVAERLP